MIDLAKLKADYDEVCDRYAQAFCEMYGYSPLYCWWVADERGGVFCINDLEYSIGMDDLVYIVDKQVTEDIFKEWWYYCIDNEEYSLTLRAYINKKKAGLL